jgi:hypothetical protein
MKIRNGIAPANPTTPSQKAELVRVNTSQPWATFCIQVPMLERKFPAPELALPARPETPPSPQPKIWIPQRPTLYFLRSSISCGFGPIRRGTAFSAKDTGFSVKGYGLQREGVRPSA